MQDIRTCRECGREIVAVRNRQGHIIYWRLEDMSRNTFTTCKHNPVISYDETEDADIHDDY